ncbi:MAG: beta-ketoacyl synthase N-terminal-like domain-containing protein [Dehalococcoidales bacterium]|nr:beta-ketoacyl synthase N-terminal-like domain-containing protein [Dehalococcoidales bacterium]
MRKVAVVGVGQTKFSGAQARTNMELFTEAAEDALQDAGIKPGAVQALLVGNVLSDFEEGQQIAHTYIAENLGLSRIPANTYDGACASSSVAIHDAFIWVASGMFDIVLAGGMERAASMGTRLATQTYAMYTDRFYDFPSGITFPGVFALLANLYAHKYGIEMAKLKEQMALVSVKAHKYGLLNPKAHLRREMTVEKVLRSPMVSQPLQVYDCCPFSDGASAIVVASEETAKKLTDRPIFITGVGQASAGTLASQQHYLPHLIAREVAVKKAYSMAGVSPGDIDICELHDSFSISEILAIESLGFFDRGTGGEATARGDTMIGGKIAVNPSGGLKAKGHPVGATGAAQVYEIYRQLRGECGETQVEGARIGLADAMGASGNIHCNMILQRGW